MAATEQITNSGTGDGALGKRPYMAQSFTPANDFNVTKVVFKRVRRSDPDSSMSDGVVKIEQTTAGKPNGTVLAQGTLSMSDLPAGSPGATQTDVDVVLGANPLLSSGTVYAMTLYVPDYDFTGPFEGNLWYILWHMSGSDQYAGGDEWYKDPLGLFDGNPVADWVRGGANNVDHAFAIWGTTQAGGGSLPGAGINPIEQGDATQTLFGIDRPGTYDPDQVYLENAWTDIAGQDAFAGGGRWQQQLVVVGKDVIYYEAIS
jgi:hypothetical protein